MPTPAEKRALLFLAGLAALGVAARGFHAVRADPRTVPLAADRSALARQIAAVDSAIAADGARRRNAIAAGSAGANAAGRGRRAAGAAPAASRRRRNSAAVDGSEAPYEPPPLAGRAGRSRAAAAAPAAGPADVREEYRKRWERQDADRRRANDPDASRTPAPRQSRAPSLRDRPPVDLDVAPVDEVASLPMIGPALARRIVADRIERGPFGSFDGLGRVRGIGPALARRLQPYVTFSLASRLESVPKATPAPRRRRRLQ